MFQLKIHSGAKWLALGAAFLGMAAKSGAQPAGAGVSVKINVPASMRSAPFNVDRFLNLPPNFGVSVLARVPGARFMAVAPNGDILVSNPGAGKVELVRPQKSGDPLVSDFVSGLRSPHDIVFHAIGGTNYVYISESNEINRFVYNTGDATAGARQVVVANLPDASSPELHGSYGHQLKNLALGPDDKLYVEVSSATNADPSDTTSNPVRCAVYQYNADGTNGRLFARGLRNPEGLAFVPGTNDLWATVNNRDNTAYPFHNGFNGDSTDDYGKVMPAYVDNHPPDEFTHVKDGANYGWPFANPDPDTPAGMDLPPFDFDVQNNPDGSSFPLSDFTRIDKGIQAHSAVLGLSFLQNTLVPQDYRNGVVMALHGSWNRTVPTGYKVIFFPWQGGKPGAQMDFATGWLDPASHGVWGRPVDVVPDFHGNLLISDDASGTIYQVSPTTTAPVSSSWNAIDIAAGSDNISRVLYTAPDGRARIVSLNAARTAITSSTTYGAYPNWTAREIRVGSDGKTRALWTNTDGRAILWRVGADGSVESLQVFGPFDGWTAVSFAGGGDGKTRVLWTNTDGRIALWRLTDDGTLETNDIYGPFPGWTAKLLCVGSDNKFRVQWTNADGRASFWVLSADRQLEQSFTYGPYAGWTPISLAVGDDGQTRVLWQNSDGRVILWSIASDGSFAQFYIYGPYSGWTARALAVGADGKSRVLWTQNDGHASTWLVAPDGTFGYGDLDPMAG